MACTRTRNAPMYREAFDDYEQDLREWYEAVEERYQESLSGSFTDARQDDYYGTERRTLRGPIYFLVYDWVAAYAGGGAADGPHPEGQRLALLAFAQATAQTINGRSFRQVELDERALRWLRARRADLLALAEGRPLYERFIRALLK